MGGFWLLPILIFLPQNCTFKIPLSKYVYTHGLAFISEYQVAVTAQGSLNGAIVDLSLKKVIKNLTLGGRACHLLVFALKK